MSDTLFGAWEAIAQKDFGIKWKITECTNKYISWRAKIELNNERHYVYAQSNVSTPCELYGVFFTDNSILQKLILHAVDTQLIK